MYTFMYTQKALWLQNPAHFFFMYTFVLFYVHFLYLYVHFFFLMYTFFVFMYTFGAATSYNLAPKF